MILIDKKIKPVVALFVLGIIGLLAGILMFWITPNGIGIGPDSIGYIETSQSLLEGKGFYFLNRPMTHWPPVYPSLLAIVGVFKDDKIQAARWLNVLVYGTNVFLIGLCAYTFTDYSLLALICSLILFISSESMLLIHTMAWSEPLFILFVLSGVLFVSFYILRPKKYLLVLAALSIGLALATRYVGITLFPVVFICLLFLSRRSFGKKMRDMFILFFISSLPLALWMIRNVILVGNPSNRTITFHPFALSKIKTLFYTFYGYLMPIHVHGGIKILQLVILGGMLFIAIGVVFHKNLIKKQETDVATVFQFFGTLFFISYISFLFISITFIDAHTPLDKRILSPLYVFIILLPISFCWSLYRIGKNQTIIYILLVCFSFVFPINLDRAISMALDVHKNGKAFNTPEWRNSETITFLRLLPDERKIYSNADDVVYWFTQKNVEKIPEKIDPESRLLNNDFDNELEIMCKNIKVNGDYLAYFDKVTWRDYLPPLDEIQQKCELSVIRRLSDGIIYGQGDADIQR